MDFICSAKLTTLDETSKSNQCAPCRAHKKSESFLLFFRFLSNFAFEIFIAYNNFMIESVPHIQSVMDDYPSPRLKELVGQINDKYLYWSDVKYRVGDSGLTPSELWSYVKRIRQKTDVEVWGEHRLHFSLTNRMQRLCHEFDLNFGGSWGAMKLFPEDKTNQELYLISSIMEEAISSSQMEGASTTREEAKEMLRRKREPNNRSQRMILNNYKTIQFISTHQHQPLTSELLLHVHALMTEGTLDNPEDAGRIRSTDDIVVGNSITGEIVHRPPTYLSLPSFVERLCEFFNNEDHDTHFIHPIIRGLIIHFLVAYYHPFVDGNGRTARALFYWYMMKENYWLMQYLSISRIICRSKSRYEKSFLYTENDMNDLGYFITYNLDVLEKAFDELKRYLLKKRNERKRASRFLNIPGVSQAQSEIVRMFYDNEELRLEAKDVAMRFCVSRVTAKSYLENLVELGILQRIHPNGRTHAFVRSDKFDSNINRYLLDD